MKAFLSSELFVACAIAFTLAYVLTVVGDRLLHIIPLIVVSIILSLGG